MGCIDIINNEMDALCDSVYTKRWGEVASLLQHLRLNCRQKENLLAKKVLRNSNSWTRKRGQRDPAHLEYFTELELSMFKDHQSDVRLCDLDVIEFN